MTVDVLRCRCGIEVRVVRLNARTLALGHVQRPKGGSHYVQLSRSADGRSGAVPSQGAHVRREDNHRLTEGLASRSGRSLAGPSDRRASGRSRVPSRSMAVTLPSSAGIPSSLDRQIDRSAGPDACWEWRGSRNPKGYGRTFVGGRHVRVHRLVLAASLGRELLPDELACHRCNNPPCCNPDHLYAGSRRDNALDAVSAGLGTKRQDRCKRGHDMSVHRVVWGRRQQSKCRECHRLRQQQATPSSARSAVRRGEGAPPTSHPYRTTRSAGQRSVPPGNAA